MMIREDKPDQLTARELAERGNTTVRTVHYYVSEGLLPPPEGTTRNAMYRDTHLARLKVIAALRAEGLSLAAIRARLSPLSDDGVREVLGTLERFEEDIAAGSVTVLGLIEAAVVDQAAPEPASSPSTPAVSFMMSAAPPQEELEDPGSARHYVERLLRSQSPAPRAARLSQQAPEPPPASETWHHFAVDEGIEIRIREDRLGPDRRRVDAFVERVREQARRDLRRRR